MDDKFEFREIVCPVCSAVKSKTIGYRGGDAHQAQLGVRTRIVRCLECTHQYPNPMPFPIVSLEELYGSAGNYFERHDLETKKKTGLLVLKDLERRMGYKGRILDVGCGRGELLWAANESGWEYEGVDTSKEFIDFGSDVLGVNGKLGTLEEADFPQNHFDAVVIGGGLIEHLYDPARILPEVYRVLCPKGWFHLDALNEDGLYMRLGNIYMKMLGRDWVVVLAPTFTPFHVQGFNPTSLRKLITLSGFKIRDFSIMGEISPQTGRASLRKRAEYYGAGLVNRFGKLIGQGMYMYVSAQKSGS